MNTITATDLARDTRQLLDRVAGQGETLEVQRHQTTVALLSPAPRTMTAAQALAGLKPLLTPREAAAWAKNSRAAFDERGARSVAVIFDSSVWIALSAGQLSHDAVIAASGDAPVFTSAIALGELHFGVQACADPAQRAGRAAFLRQIEQRPTLPVTAHTAAAFGVLAAAVKQAGRSPRPRFNDLWIAAQAIEHGHGVMTLNDADFAGLPGLRLVPIAAG